METEFFPIKYQLTQVEKLGAGSLLLITTFFWGITFTMVKEAVAQVDVFVFLTQRFSMAFLILLVISLILRRPFNLRLLRQGILLGIFLFASYAFQTVALRFTTASNAAFLTGLSVVLVPVIGGLFFRQYIPRNVQLGVVLATVGLFFLCTNGTWTINRGDLLAMLCAVCVAIHILLTGKYARDSDVYWLTAVQLGMVAVLSSFVAKLGGHPVLVWYPQLAWTYTICVLFATLFAFLVQTSVQRFLSPSHTALIFCMEPVFAALYAYWVGNERLGIYGLIGALLITAGMVISQVFIANMRNLKIS